MPTLNTIILLLSGVTVTLAHQAIILGDRMDSLTALLMTVVLGVEFTLCQIFEYTHIQLQINESSFGSIFFFSTGFQHFDEHFQILEFVNLKWGGIRGESLAWEYREKIRPWFQPWLFYL